MTNPEPLPAHPSDDLGEYCRRVEDHLTRENQGHLVRIVGPGFDLVRTWALEGIPLSLVLFGITRKAERHRAGRATRPLRIEFCDADVREAFDNWRRSVGFSRSHETVDEAAASQAEPPKKSLSREIDRALDRLTPVLGRLDLPEATRDDLGTVVDELSRLREQTRTLRGAARDVLSSRLEELDHLLGATARSAVDADTLAAVVRDAESDLAAYRGRLSSEMWTRSLEVTVDRLLRERLKLPTLI